MSSFSPNSSNFGWQLEDILINELRSDELFAHYSPNDQDTSKTSITASNSMKRSIHNEYERDRRKKLNSLYSTLRNLLPETDESKKLSIPCTIARVLKYIPELQKNIKRMAGKKEEILLSMSKRQNFVIEPTISAKCLNKKEVIMQICIKNRSEMIPLSNIVKILEGEGLELMNASTIANYADGIFYSLHLQAKDIIWMDGESYCVHLINVLKEASKS
ncbi:uncharacterized protein A4U43_C05F650 [Asparagus officinalis]|uniref:Protein IRON-RELATED TRANSCRIPTION FACTOR 2 n=1 Tax=Asparagus officinalis TaxID=4686 RepID=A0A5P1ENI6_ASPOF|nr:uncharacterized protein A4U43_C05F650 [Asparagus officinalis]